MKKAAIVPSKGETTAQLRVLDLASPGWHTLRTYHESIGGRKISLKAVDFCPEKMIVGLKDPRINITEALKRVDFTRAQASLPKCLKEEPSNYYDHVHFHMFTTTDEVTKGYTFLDEKKTIGMFNEINRIMRGDGLFFFSADHMFTIASEKTKDHYSHMSFLHNTVGAAFEVLGYAMTEQNSKYILDSGTRPEFKKLFELFKLEEKTDGRQYWPYDLLLVNLYRIFSLFSEDSGSAEYLAVSRKAPQIQ